MRIFPILWSDKEEQDTKRTMWEMYTANCLGAVVNSLGGKIAMYTELVASPAAEQSNETEEEIERRLLERL